MDVNSRHRIFFFLGYRTCVNCLTSSSKLSVSNVVTLQTLPVFFFFFRGIVNMIDRGMVDWISNPVYLSLNRDSACVLPVGFFFFKFSYKFTVNYHVTTSLRLCFFFLTYLYFFFFFYSTLRNFIENRSYMMLD